jgi:hypothetical protein
MFGWFDSWWFAQCKPPTIKVVGKAVDTINVLGLYSEKWTNMKLNTEKILCNVKMLF